MASTDLAVIDGNSFLALNHDTVELQAIIDDNLGGEQIGENDLPKVSIPPGGGGRWTIPTAFGEDSDPELTGILVMAKRTRAYWPNPDPTGEPPVCRSLDAKVGTGKQWATLDNPDPYGEPKTLACSECPMSQYGSSVKSDNAQACSEKEIWFLLREGSLLPLVLALPATSLKDAKRYRLNLASGGVKLTDVVTSITLRKEKGKAGDYGIAVPKVRSRLESEAATRAKAYADFLRPSLEQAAAKVTTDSEVPA